jgi:CHAT domain-containing protein
MSRKSSRRRRVQVAVWCAAHCCCFSVLFLNATAIPRTRRVADRKREESVATESEKSTPMNRQGSAVSQSRNAGNDLLSDAARLRSEWEAKSLRIAIEKYQSAIAFFKEAGDKSGEAKALMGAGEVLAILGEQDAALVRYRQALRFASALGDPMLEVDILNRLAEIEIDKRDRSRAYESHAQRSAELAEQSDYALGLAGALINLGVIADISNQPEKALGSFNRALALFGSEHDPAGQAEALINLGLSYGNSGSVNKAQELFDRALSFAQAAGDRRKEARIDLGAALVLTANAEWQKALQRFQDTVSLARRLGDRVALGLALNGLGSVYEELGEVSKSLANFSEARAVWHGLGHRAREAYTLRHIAAAYAETGREQEALRVYARLIRISRDLREPKIEAYALADEGLVYESLGNLRKARDRYVRAIAIGKSLYHPRAQAYSLARLGDLYQRMKKPKEAKAQQEAALSLMIQAGDRAGEMLVRYSIARFKQSQGEIEEALADTQQIINAAETRRAEFVSSDLKASYFASIYRNYELLIDLHMQEHAREPAARHDVAALEASELARARSLTETLAQVRADLPEGVPDGLLEEKRIVSVKLRKTAADEMALREIRFRLTQTKPQKGETAAEGLARNGQSLESVGREITDLEAQLDQVTSKIEAYRPKKYANLLRAPRAGLKQLQDTLLDADTLALEYFLGEERSYLWVIGHDSLTSRVLPGRAEIERQAYRFYKALTSISKAKPRDGPLRPRTNPKSFAAARARLSRTVLAPIEGLAGFKRLVIIPDGALQFIPFASLIEPSSNQPLVVGHEVVWLPSLSLLSELREETSKRQRAPKTLAVLADPVVEEHDPRLGEDRAGTQSGSRTRAGVRGRGFTVFEGARNRLVALDGADEAMNLVRLPFAAEEAEMLAALVPPSERLLATGFEADRRQATSDELAQYRMIHFATHGLLDFQRPRLSCLVLSRFDRTGKPQDGYFRLQDVYNMKLDADVVVLSACQTALGKEIRGEGLVGLTRGFLYAGAARVVASLWNVDDRASAKLMERFYRKMLGPEPLSPAAALRAAQIEMMREKRWEDPYYWAGFVLQGDWK